MNHRHFLLLVLAALTISGAFAQHKSHQQVSVLIDGARNPELISDQTAVKIFFLSITEPPDANQEQLARLKVKISRIDLNPTDRDTLMAAAQEFYPRLGALKAQADIIAGQLAVGSATREQFVNIQRQVDQLAINTYDLALLPRLSPDGAAKLRNHLKYIKGRTKIVPPPQM